MEANSILQSELLDILFEGRNKEYGAYALRKTYNKRITNAIAITILACLLLFVLSLFAGSKRSTIPQLTVSPVINLSDVDEKRPIKSPPVVHRVQQQVATRRVTIPRIVKDDDVKPEDKPPANDELDNVKIGLENKAGVSDIVAPPVEEGTGNVETPKVQKQNYDSVWTNVQIEAQFPGGIDAWVKYLQQNLRTEVPVDNGAPEGSYTVVVSFLVDRDGNISEVQALNDPGYGTADEAVRVIKKSKQWIPANQNGRSVIYRQTQAITFVVQGQ